VKRSIADVWAVLVYSPGANTEKWGRFPISGGSIDSAVAWEAGNREASHFSVLKAVEKQWETEHAPGISIARLDRTDPRERTLRSFVGLEPSGPDWVGVVFGRGTLLAPPLQGDDITESNLNRLLTGLTIPCTCLQQSMTLGLGLPMTWEPELDVKAAAAVQSVLDYMETTVNLTPSPEPSEKLGRFPVSGGSITRAQALRARDATVEAGNREASHFSVLTMALLPLGGAVGIALLAVAGILWRARRRRAMPVEE
jgi:hypothetical protein